MNNIYEKANNDQSSKKIIKNAYFNACVICGRMKHEINQDGDSLDGAHLWDAGLARFKHLKWIPGAMFPMCRKSHEGKLNHDTWDKLTQWEKAEKLIDNAHHEYRQKVVTQIETMTEKHLRGRV